MSTPEERAYIDGKQRALLSMLRYCLSALGLGIEDQERGRAEWVVERQETILALRRICGAHGDNDWENTLHIPDIIEKHLEEYLDAEDE